jgi:hypothetical protein
MEKSLFLVITLVFMSWGQAYADLAFSMGGTATAVSGSTYSYDFTGTLTSLTNTPDALGNVVVSGGSLTATGQAYQGTIFTVAQLPANPGNLNGYATGTVRSAFGGDVYTYDNVIAPGINPVLPAAQAGLILLGLYNGQNIVIGLSAAGPSNYVIFDHSYANDPYNLGYTLSGMPLVNAYATATPTPVPAAAWLLGSGLLGLAGIRRSKEDA